MVQACRIRDDRVGMMKYPPLESLRTPEEAGGSEAMVNASGCFLLFQDELVVMDSGVSMATKATSEDRDGE